MQSEVWKNTVKILEKKKKFNDLFYNKLRFQLFDY